MPESDTHSQTTQCEQVEVGDQCERIDVEAQATR
jgi:hypothetical protein